MISKELLINPLLQGLIAAALMLLVLLSFRIAGKPIAGWNSTVFVILLFCLINAVFGVMVQGVWMYLLKSLGVFFALMLLAVIFASVISGKSYEDFGENAMIFVAPLIIYPKLILIMAILRLFR